MAVTTIHQSKIIEEYNQKEDSEKIKILENAHSIMESRSYYSGKDHLICESMGYKLWNCGDQTWYEPKKGTPEFQNIKCK